MNINKFTQKSYAGCARPVNALASDYGNQETCTGAFACMHYVTQDDSLIAKLMEKMGHR